MSENIYFAAFFFPTAALAIIFFMKYVSQILQARVQMAQDKAYRELAAQMAASQAEFSTTLIAYGSALSDIQARLASLEKVLKEVE